jgi:rRNA-processing protein FCF1
MKVIIETNTIARCAETGVKIPIGNLEKFKKIHEVVEDKTKPVVKKTKRVISEFSEFKKLEEEE